MEPFCSSKERGGGRGDLVCHLTIDLAYGFSVLQTGDIYSLSSYHRLLLIGLGLCGLPRENSLVLRGEKG